MSIDYDRKDLFLFDYNIENLKKLRIECGLLQKEVAKILGVHQVTVCQWENGKVTNPIVLQMYGIFLERYYARKKGYIPAFRKIGEETIKLTEEVNMLTTDSKYTVEEIVRMNKPCMPAASGNLWETLEFMAKEIDSMKRTISEPSWYQSVRESNK